MSDSDKANPANDAKTTKAQAAAAPGLPGSVSQLVGVHLAAAALATTYLVGVLNGVSTLTSLLRAAVVGVAFFILGRIAGFMVGRILERHLMNAETTANGEVAR